MFKAAVPEIKCVLYHFPPEMMIIYEKTTVAISQYNHTSVQISLTHLLSGMLLNCLRYNEYIFCVCVCV